MSVMDPDFFGGGNEWRGMVAFSPRNAQPQCRLSRAGFSNAYILVSVNLFVAAAAAETCPVLPSAERSSVLFGGVGGGWCCKALIWCEASEFEDSHHDAVYIQIF